MSVFDLPRFLPHLAKKSLVNFGPLTRGQTVPAQIDFFPKCHIFFLAVAAPPNFYTC